MPTIASRILQHPGLPIGDALRVVVQHRAGRFADARDVMRVGRMHRVTHGTCFIVQRRANRRVT